VSYTNPNAKCPVCGALVYFYQSPSGGRVFFDDLGPPWPKHPCTVGSSAIISRATITTKQIPQWSREGWKPALQVSISEVADANGIYRARITRPDLETWDGCVLFFESTENIAAKGPPNLAQYKLESTKKWRLSLWYIKDGESTFFAFEEMPAPKTE
jgi:hypothetical protein